MGIVGALPASVRIPRARMSTPPAAHKYQSKLAVYVIPENSFAMQD